MSELEFLPAETDSDRFDLMDIICSYIFLYLKVARL